MARHLARALGCGSAGAAALRHLGLAKAGLTVSAAGPGGQAMSRHDVIGAGPALGGATGH